MNVKCRQSLDNGNNSQSWPMADERLYRMRCSCYSLILADNNHIYLSFVIIYGYLLKYIAVRSHPLLTTVHFNESLFFYHFRILFRIILHQYVKFLKDYSWRLSITYKETIDILHKNIYWQNRTLKFIWTYLYLIHITTWLWKLEWFRELCIVLKKTWLMRENQILLGHWFKH